MGGTLKVQQLTTNGVPYGCPECGSRALMLDQGPFDGMPADLNCCFCPHYWTDGMITGTTVVMIAGSRSGRRKARDEDTFTVTVDGVRFEGTLQPELITDDLKVGGRTLWRRGIKPSLRRRKKAAVRTVARPGKNAVEKVGDAARDVVATTKTAALTAAWDAQAGGHTPDLDHRPEPVIPCGAGCTDGWFPLDSRIHGIDKVRCIACRGTGEAL
jgi:hypothetical protein